MHQVTIYTDGCCKGNPGTGGWGAVLLWFNPKDNKPYHKEISCGSPDTTNNIMELSGCIEALKCLQGECEVTLYTDSKYVKQGITSWIRNWKKNGWLTTQKKPVANKELWLELDRLAVKHHVKFRWVKGHGDNKLNELADALANSGCDAVRSNEMINA